jgi:hypothetical protein
MFYLNFETGFLILNRTLICSSFSIHLYTEQKRKTLFPLRFSVKTPAIEESDVYRKSKEI